MVSDKWHPFDNGSTIGKIETEDGVVIRDEEYGNDARITTGRNGEVAPFAITLGIYGFTFHTSFYGNEMDAQNAFNKIKPEIENIVNLLPRNEKEYDKNKLIFGKAMQGFIDKVENIAYKH
jgi:hypothetical protein